MKNITFFVKRVRDASPKVWPTIIMTDCNQAQIKALEMVHSQNWIFLCHWHVLHAMQSHFITMQFKLLWQMIRLLVLTDN